jgi:hypothetical protein
MDYLKIQGINNLNTTKMKKAILIIGMITLVAITMTSCASQRSGCKTTQRYIGYGSR